MADRPPFPGAVAVSHLRVYDTPGPDGLVGGSPHLHTACTEAYAVTAGRGSVQSLSGEGEVEVPLEPGSFVWFTPGTVHRLVNGGDLEILVVMGNAGLPEAGDLVLTFPDPVLADPAAYAAAATLPPDGATTEGDPGAAHRRRDLAVEGFIELREAVRRDGPGALGGLHGRAAALVADRVAGWRRVWEHGPPARTGDHLEALATADGRAPVRAEAGEGTLTVTCSPHPRHGPQPMAVEVHAPGLVPADVAAASWSLPGLAASVATDAPVAAVDDVGDGTVVVRHEPVPTTVRWRLEVVAGGAATGSRR